MQILYTQIKVIIAYIDFCNDLFLYSSNYNSNICQINFYFISRPLTLNMKNIRSIQYFLFIDEPLMYNITCTINCISCPSLYHI